MNAVDAVLLIGGWGSLLGGSAVWIVRRGQQAAVNWLLSLAVILFYYSMVLRYLFAELDWGSAWALGLTRFDVSAVLIPAGLFCCWFAKDRWPKGLGAAIIVAGFVNVFPGLWYPIEGVGTGNGPVAG